MPSVKWLYRGDFEIRLSDPNENEESSVGNITELWNRLTANKYFHVLLKTCDIGRMGFNVWE